MEINVGFFIVLFSCACVCGLVNSSLGMGYGTLLTPLLMLTGFEPEIAVPAVLLSQAFGSFFGAMAHHHLENVKFSRGSEDFKVAIIIGAAGVIVTVLGAWVALEMPRKLLKSYIGVIVLLVGVFVFLGLRFRFSWRKIFMVGIIGSLNKVITGGGFGPMITGGQVLSGKEHKSAVGVTLLTELPICMCGFFTYLVMLAARYSESPVMEMPFADFSRIMFSHRIFRWELLLAVVLGAVCVAPFGALLTRVIVKDKMRYFVGAGVALLGLLNIVKLWT